MPNRILLGSIAALGCLAVGLTACSSNSSKRSAGTAGNTSTTAGVAGSQPSGSPVTVAIINEAFGTEADFAAGARAAAAAVNASGGIGGHPVKLDICNVQTGDVNGATQCARNAIADPSVVAFVNNTLEGSQVDPLLAQAGIACLDCTIYAPGDFTSPIMFGYTDSLLSTGIAGVAAVKQLHLNKIALPGLATSSNPALIALVKGIVGPVGGQVVSSPAIALTAVDVSAPVAAMGAAHPDVMVDGLTNAVFSRVIHAMRQQGQNYPVIVSGGVYNASEISSQLPGVSSNIYVAALYDHESAGFHQFLQDMSKYSSGANTNDTTADPWTAIRLFLAKEIAAKIGSGGTVDRAGVLAAAKQVSTNFDGMTPTLNFGQPVSLLGGALTRDFNPSQVLYKYSNGQEVPVNSGNPFVSLSS